MTTEYMKPLPQPTDENGPFLEGLLQKELRLQKCANCGRYRYPAARFCPNCLTEGGEWEAVSGKGSLYSFIIVHQMYHPGFRDDIPYNVAVVQLAEGPRVTTNIVGCANEDLSIGMDLRAEFVQVSPEAAVLKFSPA